MKAEISVPVYINNYHHTREFKMLGNSSEVTIQGQVMMLASAKEVYKVLGNLINMVDKKKAEEDA